MPPTDPPEDAKSLLDIVESVGVYPIEAYEFVQQGLTFTVQNVHAAQTDPEASRHVSGQQLCEGLRELARERWGMLACTVLARWNITSTTDFGRIVFAMVENGFLSKTEQDNLDDFKNVYDFKTSFEGYRIESAK